MYVVWEPGVIVTITFFGECRLFPASFANFQRVSRISCEFRQFLASFANISVSLANFLRVSPIFSEFREFSASFANFLRKMAFLFKTNVMIKILKKNILSKKQPFLAKIFLRKYF
jgi:hypothetical protein